ncbi:MAG TPA: hypothetical protein V6C63_06535 [Allocoleopsis sp.]
MPASAIATPPKNKQLTSLDAKAEAIADPEKQQIVNNILGVLKSSNADASALLSFGLQNGKIAGRYRAGTQVYDYEMSPDSIDDVPVPEGRGDSYLRGYYSGFEPAIATQSKYYFKGWLSRFDAKSSKSGTGFGKKPKCTEGKSRLCGGTCIPLLKENGEPRRCRSDPSPKDKQTILDTIRSLEKRQGERSPAAPVTTTPEPEKPKAEEPPPEKKPESTPQPKKPAHQGFIETGDRLISDEARQKLDALTAPSGERLKLAQDLNKIKAGLKSDKIQGEKRKKLQEIGRATLAKYKELEKSENEAAAAAMKDIRDRMLRESAKQYRQKATDFAKGINIDDKATGENQSGALSGPVAGSGKAPMRKSAAELRKDAFEYYLLTKGKGADSIQNFTYERDRASANPEQKKVDIGKSPTKQIMFHEMAHHMEYNNPAIAAAAVSWIQSRATGGVQKLKDITGNQRYRDTEVAYTDKFLSPYVGKIYPYKGTDGKTRLRPATEAISMGVERMATPEDMVNFYRQDPEHFKFILGVLAA